MIRMGEGCGGFWLGGVVDGLFAGFVKGCMGDVGGLYPLTGARLPRGGGELLGSGIQTLPDVHGPSCRSDERGQEVSTGATT
jgi:hypothetical protein